MGFEALIPLIVQYGIPLAELVWQKIEAAKAGTPVTQGDWDTLKKLASQDATSQMADALVRNNIDPKSTVGQNLIALVK